LLEAGQLEAAILDPWTGKLHQASASMWRRFGADRMIEKGIPRSPNTGKLLVKRLGEGKSAYQADARGQNLRYFSNSDKQDISVIPINTRMLAKSFCARVALVSLR